MSNKEAVTEYLAEHPRTIGILFAMFLLVSQAGSVVAGNSGATAGP